MLIYAWVGSAQAHNLDQKNVYIAFDQTTRDLMASRAGLGQNLLQKDDVVGLILKSIPADGTDNGAGGYLTFYIPPGTNGTNLSSLL